LIDQRLPKPVVKPLRITSTAEDRILGLKEPPEGGVVLAAMDGIQDFEVGTPSPGL
jgi:hypothetical protein